MDTTNSPAGQPTYTAAQYEERIERLYAIVEAYEWQSKPFYPGARECRWCWQSEGEGHARRCRVAEALCFERAHRTADAAGMTGGYHVHDAACAQRRGASDGMGPMASESEVERARRLA